MIDPRRALEHLAEATGDGPWPQGAPAHELTRSPAAAAVGRLAARDGLFLFHFEHRLCLDLPAAWVDPSRQSDAVTPPWRDGCLEERKYQSFRHDLLIGSFHPGHRAKWTAHELCHALVGFGWRADASVLWTATASRLAELLPVVLWYFLDEVGLRRCPLHTGPLFRTFCPHCERIGSEGARAVVPADLESLQDAARFLDRELAAIARSRRTGQPVSHQWGSLDLCSDGIAYAVGHGRRLRSATFARFAERFLVGTEGWFDDLDALEARVVEVARGIAEGEPVRALADSPEVGRARWIAQDLGHRLLQIHEETDGACAAALLALVDDIADGLQVARAHERYQELYASWHLPPVEAVFAVGYPLQGVPSSSAAQIDEGLASVVPLTLDLLEDAGARAGFVQRFVQADEPARVPLGDRFAAWMEHESTRSVSDLTRYEAALRHVRGDAVAVALGAGDGWRWAEGSRVLLANADVAELGHQVETGASCGFVDDAGRLSVQPEPEARSMALVVGQDSAGEAVVAEVPGELDLTSPAALPAEVVAALVELELVVADQW